jgi:hypothetical protein
VFRFHDLGSSPGDLSGVCPATGLSWYPLSRSGQRSAPVQALARALVCVAIAAAILLSRDARSAVPPMGEQPAAGAHHGAGGARPVPSDARHGTVGCKALQPDWGRCRNRRRGGREVSSGRKPKSARAKRREEQRRETALFRRLDARAWALTFDPDEFERAVAEQPRLLDVAMMNRYAARSRMFGGCRELLPPEGRVALSLIPAADAVLCKPAPSGHLRPTAGGGRPGRTCFGGV